MHGIEKAGTRRDNALSTSRESLNYFFAISSALEKILKL